MKYTYSIFFIFFLCATSVAHGQEFAIKDFAYMQNDLSAQIESRADLNGVKCGLIKVRCVLDGVSFKGNVIGDVDYKEGEYWVYLSNGSKSLNVHHSKLLPLDIDLERLYKSPIKSSSTYLLTLSIPEALYTSTLNNQQSTQPTESYLTTSHQPDNTTLIGYVKDAKNGEELIGATVIIKELNRGVAADFDGFYKLQDVPSQVTISYQYVGHKSKDVTFVGKIPERFDVNLKTGRGTEKEEYFYDPDDKSEYFDLKGNKLLQRPTKKGVYIRIVNGKSEKFTVK